MADHLAALLVVAVAFGAAQSKEEHAVVPHQYQVQEKKLLSDCLLAKAQLELKAKENSERSESLLSWLVSTAVSIGTTVCAAIAAIPTILRKLRECYNKEMRKYDLRSRKNYLWNFITNNGGTDQVAREIFEDKIGTDPFFGYLSAEISTEMLSGMMDRDNDGFITRKEFDGWYEHLEKTRPDAYDPNIHLHTIFVGEARVGKSTLLNSLLRKNHFDAGRTRNNETARTGFGIGYKSRDSTNCPRSLYVNIPGAYNEVNEESQLVDDLIRVAVTPRNASVKLVFVVTHRSGTITESTKNIIRRTVQMSPCLVSYAVIVNMCSQAFMKDIEDVHYRRSWVKNQLKIDGHKPLDAFDEVFFYPLDPNAFDSHNAYLLDANDTHRNFQLFLFNVKCNDMRDHPEADRVDEVAVKQKGESYEQQKKRKREEAEEVEREAKRLRISQQAAQIVSQQTCIIA